MQNRASLASSPIGLKVSKRVKELLSKHEGKVASLTRLFKRQTEIQKALQEPQDPHSVKIRELENELHRIEQRIEKKQAEQQVLEIKLAHEKNGRVFTKNLPDLSSKTIQLENLLADNDEEIDHLLKDRNHWRKQYETCVERLKEVLAENKRLKQLSGKPNLKPAKDSSRVQNGAFSPQDGKKRRRGGSQKGKTRKNKQEIPIHEVRVLPFPSLPAGFKFLGYQDYTVQDLCLKPHTIQYRIPRFYNCLTHETFSPDLPENVNGHFGGEFRAFVLYLNHHGRVPENKIVSLLKEFGFEISRGQVHKILTEKHERFHEEKAEILTAALEVSKALQTDEMGARHSGHNGYCNVLCNELFTVFHTTESKSRLNFLSILTQGVNRFVFNAEALAYLRRLEVPQKWLTLFVNGPIFDLSALTQALKQEGLFKGSKIYQNLCEAGLLGQLIEKGVNREMILHSDGGRQFCLFVHCLCWIHIVRPIKKLIPETPHRIQHIEETLDRFWKFYKELAAYKENPSPKEAKRLGKKFDKIFSKKSGYSDLDNVVAGILNHKSELLLVLERSEAPIHNNGSETEGREVVIRNRISKTGSELGKECRDTFLSLMKTVRKHSLSFWEYLKDRMLGLQQIKNLGALMREKAGVHNPCQAA